MLIVLTVIKLGSPFYYTSDNTNFGRIPENSVKIGLSWTLSEIF
jgi:hypothetical protein